MNARQLTLVAVLAALCVGLVALPAVADAQTTDDGTDESENGSAGLGTQMTAFMQSSAAQADDAVEDEMWEARYERANDTERDRLADARTGALEDRLDRLRERNRTIRQRYENGTLPEPAYVARSSALAGQIEALRSAVDESGRIANETGVDDERLQRLRRNASDLRGPEVAGVARGIAGRGPPEGVPGGPDGRPGEAGPPEERPGNGGPPEGVPGNGGPPEGAPGNGGADDGSSPGNNGDGAPGNGGGPSDDAGRPAAGEGDDAPESDGRGQGNPNRGGDPANTGNSGGEDSTAPSGPDGGEDSADRGNPGGGPSGSGPP